MEQRKLNAGDHDRLLELLNTVFALKDGTPVGYLSSGSGGQYIGHALNGETILELCCTSAECFIPVICAWQRRVLFGHLPAAASVPAADPLLFSWLPLPLSWCTLDVV